jgi:hypothetical protein
MPLSTISRYHAREPCLPCIIQNSVCPRLKLGYLSPVFWKSYSFSVNMVQRRISESQISFKAIGHQMGYHYTIVSRLVRKRTQTSTVKEPRSGRPHLTSQNEDRALHHLVRRMPFATSPILKRQWLLNMRNRLKSEGLQSRRVNVIRSTSMITFGMVFRATWFEFEVLAYDPLVGREPVSASCNRWTNESLETGKYGVFPKEYPANCPLRWRLSKDMGRCKL